MEKSFYLFDGDFNETSEFSSVIYIVIVDSDRAILDEELHCVWDERFIDELRNINTNCIYYKWNDDEEVYEYIPYCEEDLISKLHDLTESHLYPNESKSNEVNDTISISKKYKLYITLENGTIIEPNFTSSNPTDFAEMIEHMSSERYFAGNIKSIKIE